VPAKTLGGDYKVSQNTYLKQKEIAEILGIGVPLVKYRLKRAKQELESCLGWEA